MENRDRDKVSRSEEPTEAGDVNRETSERASRKDTSAEFGQKIGRSENPDMEPRRDRSGSSPSEH